MPPTPIDPVALRRRADALTTQFDSLENSTVDLIQRLAANGYATVEALENATAPTVAVLNQAVQQPLNSADAHAGKIASKIYNAADQHLSNAYADAALMGTVYPTIDKVHYGLQTGDIFGSMGFDPVRTVEGRDDVPVVPPTVEVLQPPDTVPLVPVAVPPAPTPTPPPTPTVTKASDWAPPTSVPPIAWTPHVPGGFGGVPATTITDEIVGQNIGGTWGPCRQRAGRYYHIPVGSEWQQVIRALQLINAPTGTEYVRPVYPNTTAPNYAGDQWLNMQIGAIWGGGMGYVNITWLQGWTLAHIYSPDCACYWLFQVLPSAFPACGTVTPPPPPPPPPPEPPTPQPPPPPPPPTTPTQCVTPPFGFPPLTPADQECTNISAFVNGLAGGMFDFQKMLTHHGLAFAGIGGMTEIIMNALDGGSTGLIAQLTQRFSCWLEGVIRQVSEKSSCDAAKMVPIAIVQGGLSFIQQWTGALPQPVLESLRQAMNSVCQSYFPGQPQADELWLTGRIDDELWTCWTKVNGNHVGPAQMSRDAKRSRPDPHQWTTLYMRDFIGKEMWQQRMHEQGVINDEEREAYRRLQIAFPHLDDVVRFMVRDVADQELVEKLGMDADFDKKWVSPLKEYADALGIDEDVAKLYWRAHWRLPSPTQLYEMLHRLRPGRVPEEVEVTHEMVESALKQDDLLPFWVGREMAVSYSVMRLVDIRRAYEVGVIDDAELVEQLQDRGYNKADAERVAEFYRVELERKRRRRAGLPGPSTYIKWFVNRVISEEELFQQLSDIGIDDDVIRNMIQQAEIDARWRDRQQIIAVVQKEYMTGLIGPGEAQQRLTEAGVSLENVAALLEQWRQTIKQKSKEVPAATLCKWRERNVITPAQQVQALIRIGYSQENAKRISQSCEFEIQERERKAMEKAMEKAKKEAEKAAKEAAKRQKELQQQLDEITPPSS